MKIIINDKTYGTQKATAKLLKNLAKTPKLTIALQPMDLSLKTKHEVWAQHVDPIIFGAHTGWILPESVKDAGAVGTLINHSEHPLSFKEIKAITLRCKEVGLKTCILVPRVRLIKKMVALKPDFIGIEPPELIGSKTNSVASKPKVIEKAVRAAGTIPLIVGAGIKDHHDYEVAKQLGAKGLLVASAIVKAKDPAKVVTSIVQSKKK